MSQRRPRDLTFWLGLGLVVAGLALLGYVGWQFFGTNIVSERRQQETVRELEQQWREAEPVRIQGERPERTADVSLGEASALIRIPRFGSDYVMPVLEGVADDALARGFGHFADSADPGQEGNYALAAHRVTHGEPLRDMPELQVGDEIIVETREATHTYVLTTGGDALEVPFTETWVIDPLPTNPDEGEPQPAQEEGQRLITLTTCAEIFATDQRLIAFGVLEETVPREPLPS